MSIETYGELKIAVQEWSNKANSWGYLDRIPDFIRSAEDRMNRTLRVAEKEYRAFKLVLAGQEYNAIPDDMMELRTLKWRNSTSELSGVNSHRLLPLTPSQADQIYKGTETGQPVHYVRYNEEFRLLPVPSGDGMLEISCYYPDVNLENDADTNWILRKYPFAYLHGSLTELYRFTKDRTARDESDAEFVRILSEIVRLDLQKTFSGLRLTTPYAEH